MGKTQLTVRKLQNLLLLAEGNRTTAEQRARMLPGITLAAREHLECVYDLVAKPGHKREEKQP